MHFFNCISLGPQPLVSNVFSFPHSVSFQAIGTGSGILGYRPCWCPSPFPFRLPYLGIFHSLFTCHWISVVFLLYDRRICTHSIDPSLADGEFPGLGLSVVPDAVIPEAEHGVRIKQKSRFNFYPGRGLNL